MRIRRSPDPAQVERLRQAGLASGRARRENPQAPGMRKPRQSISHVTREMYDEWVEVFRKHGGPNAGAVAELGWLISKTKRVFKRGYPSLGLPPVADILAEDEVRIRAARRRAEEGLPEKIPLPTEDELQANEQRAIVLADSESRRLQEMVRREEDRRKAREDAIQARSEEALLLGMQRRNAIALNGITAQLMKGAVSLAGLIQKELEEIAAGGGEMTTNQKLQLIRSAASVSRFNAEASMLAIKSERLVLGHPIEAAPEANVDDGSLEQAVDWIERAAKAVLRAKSRGLLKSGDTNAAAE